MDSRAVFRGMEIGTAQPSAAERAEVPHYGLDLADPDERFSAGAWARHARSAIEQIRARSRLPLLVGGTGFFLRALTHPIFREPPLDAARRAALAARLAPMSDAELLRWLAALDPGAAERLRAWGGRQRLLRALEVVLLTGRTLAWWHRHSPPEAPPVPVRAFVLSLPRALLHARVDARVGEMVRAGLIDEVRALAERFGHDAPGLNAHGYAELLPYLRGETTLDEALDAVRRNTRAYTRRQETWFRTQLPPGAVVLDGTRPHEELAERIVSAVSQTCVDR